MKILIGLTLLLSFVSCNDNIHRPTITNHEEVVNQYKSGLTVERGIVSITDKSGSDVSVNSETNKLSTIRISERSKSVIIHIDGENIYRYIETKNNVNGSFSKRIVLEVLNPKKELQDLLNSNLGILSGDHLVMRGTNFHESSDDAYSLESANTYTSTFNLTKSLCESTNHASKETRFRNSNGDIQTITTSINETSVCGPKYNPAQLKNIDLKNIEFCANDECSMNENMSWLTTDL